MYDGAFGGYTRWAVVFDYLCPFFFLAPYYYTPKRLQL